MTHEERMDLAARLRNLILVRYGDGVLAVFVTSSTARGLDLAHSDLELTAVHRDGAAPESRSYYHRGILIELEHIEESRILRQEMRRRWPLVAGEYRGRIVLFERDGWLGNLDAALDARDAADPVRAQRDALLEVLEYRDKLRNALLRAEPVSLHAFAGYFADAAANFVLFVNRRMMSTSRHYFPEAFECPRRPDGFRDRIEVLLGVRPADMETITTAADDLADGLLRLGAAQSIEVESADLQV